RQQDVIRAENRRAQPADALNHMSFAVSDHAGGVAAARATCQLQSANFAQPSFAILTTGVIGMITGVVSTEASRMAERISDAEHTVM
ncbi:hypothetical protein C1X25_35935, partial [Pseudomonas sp. GW247-3R2A]